MHELKIRSFPISHGALTDVPILPFDDSNRSRSWMAVINPNPKAPGGLDRKFMPRARGDYFYVVAEQGLAPGQVVEFGADYVKRGGKRLVRRWYGAIVSVDTSALKLAEAESPKHAFNIADEMKKEQNHPVPIRVITLEEEYGQNHPQN